MIIQKALYIGRVDRWGSRVVSKNGRDCLEFSMYLPSQTIKSNGWREHYSVRVSAWGPDGTIDKRPKKGDIVCVMGIPSNKERANALMCFTRDLAIGEEEIRALLGRICEEG